MEYKPDFEHDFMTRTRQIVDEYDGLYEATLQINCLVGLLMLPKERNFFNRNLPKVRLEDFPLWGVSITSVVNPGKCDQGHVHEIVLSQFLRMLRNAVAHFRIKPIHENGLVVGFEFRDSNGFHATLSNQEIKELTIKIADHVGQLNNSKVIQ